MKIDIELLAKVLTGVAGLIVAIYQLRNLKSASRSSLKTDMEILKMMDKADPNHAMVQSYIDERLRRAYSTERSKGIKIYSWGDFFLGTLLISVFTYLTFDLNTPEFSWWSLLTGFFALVGVGAILNGLDPAKAKQKSKRP